MTIVLDLPDATPSPRIAADQCDTWIRIHASVTRTIAQSSMLEKLYTYPSGSVTTQATVVLVPTSQYTLRTFAYVKLQRCTYVRIRKVYIWRPSSPLRPERVTSSQQKARRPLSIDYCPTRATGPIIVRRLSLTSVRMCV